MVTCLKTKVPESMESDSLHVLFHLLVKDLANTVGPTTEDPESGKA